MPMSIWTNNTKSPSIHDSMFFDIVFCFRNFVNGEDKNNWMGPPHDGSMNIKSVQV